MFSRKLMAESLGTFPGRNSTFTLSRRHQQQPHQHYHHTQNRAIIITRRLIRRVDMNMNMPTPTQRRTISMSTSLLTTEGGGSNTIAIKDGLKTKESVSEFISHLSEDQKNLLYHTLNVEVLRDKYEGHLGSSESDSHHYLSKYGRPTATVGPESQANQDPTGTLCEVPPKWLHTRLDEKAHPPPVGALWAVGLKNALPFIGFGFLDNLIMILAGDYIDITIGTTLGISTMAAAALGNTISDVAGIGSAWYIEEFANKIGIKDPELTPSQFASWSVRWASNGGRAIGVVIGCLLGMVPLIFLPSAEEQEKEKREKKEKEKEKK